MILGGSLIMINVNLEFGYGFKGVLKAENHQVAVGLEKGELAPYDMLLGALASCYYSTLIDIVEKKKINFDKATISVTGEKREEIPKTLKSVIIELQIFNADSEKGVLKAAELASKYCSVYQTILKVSEMKWNVVFK